MSETYTEGDLMRALDELKRQEPFERDLEGIFGMSLDETVPVKAAIIGAEALVKVVTGKVSNGRRFMTKMVGIKCLENLVSDVLETSGIAEEAERYMNGEGRGR